VTAAELQLGAARRQIQFVVHHQDARRLNLVELRDCAHRTPAGIHEGLRFEQEHFASARHAARDKAVELALRAEACA
jgi:hypothetical protein